MNATNKVISKVSEIKTGTNEYGKWTLYSIYFEGSERKFGYLVSGKRPVPFVGMKVLYMEYTEEENEGKDGKMYKNYSIKELRVDETQNAPVGNKAPTQEEKKAYIDHGKVMIDLLQMSEFNPVKLFGLIDLFNQGIDYMLGKPIAKPKQVGGHGPDDFDSSKIPDDEIPF